MGASQEQLAMASDKPFRRLSLRELASHAEKSSHALISLLQSTVLAQVSEFRDLSRPVRRRTHYPTLFAVHNALQTLLATSTEAQKLANDLHEQLEELKERAQREKLNRV
jgi:hypothetical protein